MDDVCELGDVEFVWDRSHPLMQVLDGHGVVVINPDGSNDFGVLARDSSTVIDRSGGMSVVLGARILHNKQHCADGREEAAR